MLDKLKLEDFSTCLNQEFRIHVEGRDPVAAKLIEARGLVAPDDDPDRRQPFSLIFLGPKDAHLEQGTFHIENETLGELDLFLVTLGPDKDGLRHEAVFT